RIGGRDAARWVATMLVDANKAVCAQWQLATANPLPPAPSPPRPAATPIPHNPADTSADRSEAARAFPTTAAVNPRPEPGQTSAHRDHQGWPSIPTTSPGGERGGRR